MTASLRNWSYLFVPLF